MAPTSINRTQGAIDVARINQNRPAPLEPDDPMSPEPRPAGVLGIPRRRGDEVQLDGQLLDADETAQRKRTLEGTRAMAAALCDLVTLYGLLSDRLDRLEATVAAHADTRS